MLLCLQMGGFPGHFGAGPCLQRQQSIPEMLAGGVPLMSSVGTPLDLSHLQMPKSMFEPSPATNDGEAPILVVWKSSNLLDNSAVSLPVH